jgi:hypothetical protein
MTPFVFEDEFTPMPDERVVMLPKGLNDKKALLDFLRESIPLPPYFGGNWDALEECLSELAWLPNEKLVLMHEEIPLHGSPRDLQTYLQILAATAREEKRLRVIFPKRCQTEVNSACSGGL